MPLVHYDLVFGTVFTLRSNLTRSDGVHERAGDCWVVDNQSFDAFLSHSHADAQWTEWLARRLEDEKGLRIWLDKWVLVPGEPWQQELAKGLDEAASCCVVIGAETPGGWFMEEVQRALNRQVRDPRFRVLPVISPSGSPSSLPAFAELRTWVDFRDGQDVDYAFHVLVQGIRGLPVGRWTPPPPAPVSETARTEILRARLHDIAAVADLLEREVLVQMQLKTLNAHFRELP